jgi:hypothetical protein
MYVQKNVIIMIFLYMYNLRTRELYNKKGRCNILH